MAIQSSATLKSLRAGRHCAGAGRPDLAQVMGGSHNHSSRRSQVIRGGGDCRPTVGHRTKLPAYAGCILGDERGASGLRFKADFTGNLVTAQMQLVVDPALSRV